MAGLSLALHRAVPTGARGRREHSKLGSTLRGRTRIRCVLHAVRASRSSIGPRTRRRWARGALFCTGYARLRPCREAAAFVHAVHLGAMCERLRIECSREARNLYGKLYRWLRVAVGRRLFGVEHLPWPRPSELRWALGVGRGVQCHIAGERRRHCVGANALRLWGGGRLDRVCSAPAVVGGLRRGSAFRPLAASHRAYPEDIVPVEC
mmetsp:Transcript_99642/g.222613  ORF Transcript_99642/g.222613 Transcript_99642/m.222613 type:complete len:208 (-) Transcript_99642:189-812(-)